MRPEEIMTPLVFQDLIAHRQKIDEVVASHRGVRWHALAEATLNFGAQMSLHPGEDEAMSVVVEFSRHADILDLSDIQQELCDFFGKAVNVSSSRGITTGMMAMTIELGQLPG